MYLTLCKSTVLCWLPPNGDFSDNQVQCLWVHPSCTLHFTRFSLLSLLPYFDGCGTSKFLAGSGDVCSYRNSSDWCL